jgi:mannose-6-phosphate isomerase-like protein (cupin superfamily)
MDAFELSDLLGQQAALGRPYLEFLRVPDLSLGLYVLAAGGVDSQQPHTEPEAYYVISGAGVVTVGDEDRPVGPGAIIFVDAHVPHRFHSITSQLTLLVVFGPAEYSRSQA